MTYIVNDSCIACKYTDCVEVCPVDCFYEGENMLVIHPDECIDCGVCEPECPADAIRPDTEPDMEKWVEFNRKYSEIWPVIITQKDPLPEAEERDGETGKLEKYFSENESYCSSYESHRKKTEEIAAEFEEIRLSSFRFLPGESVEEREQRIKEIEDKYYEDLKKELTEFRNSCHPELREILYSEKERKIRESKAERFCNSQGIY